MSLLANLLDPARTKGPARFISRRLYSWSLAGGVAPDHLLMLPPDPWLGDAGKGRWLTGRMLEDHGQQISLDSAIWSNRSVRSDAHRCALVHGFEWLRDLRALGGDAARRLGRQFMQEWIEQNGDWQEGAWSFEVTARRVAAWLMGYEFFCASADDTFLGSFFDSLNRQFRHLDRVDAEQIHGPDLLRVIRAIFYGGLCIENEGHRLALAGDWLEHWIQNELTSEGMHISRSPAQIIDIAHILIDIRGALVRGGLAAPTLLQAAIDRAMHAIRFFRMPDGRMACFHMGREGDETSIDTLFKVSGIKIRKPLNRLEESGYESLVRERTVIVVDAGNAAAFPYDSCTHASPMAFEMAIGRDRLFVNCGTHPTDTVWADHLRATAAHTSLTLDDRNAVEIRMDGHVGRKPSSVTVMRDMLQGGGLMLTLSHDGYVPLNGIVHTRRLMLAPDGGLLAGEDGLVADAPLIKPVAYALRFHLHPRVQASVIQGGQAALLRLPSGKGWRFSQNSGNISLEPSIYCGSGNVPRKTTQLVITGTTQNACTSIGWNVSEER